MEPGTFALPRRFAAQAELPAGTGTQREEQSVQFQRSLVCLGKWHNDVGDRALKPLPAPFAAAFLQGPQQGKGLRAVLPPTEPCPLFRRTELIQKGGAPGSSQLDVNAEGRVVQTADDQGPAVADIKMVLWRVGQTGLSVGTKLQAQGGWKLPVPQGGLLQQASGQLPGIWMLHCVDDQLPHPPFVALSIA